jgi:hypothetical protein
MHYLFPVSVKANIAKPIEAGPKTKIGLDQSPAGKKIS